MSKVIEGDILTIKAGIIAHQCNCFGKSGAGIAKSITQKWPRTRKYYESFCRQEGNKKNLLGICYVVPVDSMATVQVANLFGQLSYGRRGVFTNYTALDKAFESLSKIKYGPVYAPFMLGAGLAGGDWKKIHEIAEKHIPDIIWVKYKKGMRIET